LINFNWLAKESQLKVEKEKDYSATSLYTGTCGFFQMGYAFNLGNNTKLKVYAQSGLQQYKISNGTSSSGSYVQSNSNANMIVEDKIRFIYDLNVSFEFRLNK
jgi:hypothetical protein